MSKNFPLDRANSTSLSTIENFSLGKSSPLSLSLSLAPADLSCPPLSPSLRDPFSVDERNYIRKRSICRSREIAFNLFHSRGERLQHLDTADLLKFLKFAQTLFSTEDTLDRECSRLSERLNLFFFFSFLTYSIRFISSKIIYFFFKYSRLSLLFCNRYFRPGIE